MKTGTRTNGPASLKVSYSQMVPAPLRGAVREISALECMPEHRKDGHATALMREAMRDADAARLTLVVVVKPYGECALTSDVLSAWYGRLGFVEIQAAPCVMARSPRVVQ
jgi:ribosomal protein S18 acetylase RimI-like enzyme